MKGIVFTEFVEMVESAHGADMVDTLIDQTNPTSGGIYVSTGTYDHTELVKMVQELSAQSGTAVDELLVAFGRYLMPRFSESFPHFFDPHDHLFDFLESVHGYIHVEVRKLYPDAELPELSSERIAKNKLTLIYTSRRHLSKFGQGLIEGAAKEFGCTLSIEAEPITDNSIKFHIEIVD